MGTTAAAAGLQPACGVGIPSLPTITKLLLDLVAQPTGSEEAQHLQKEQLGVLA